MEKEFEKQFKDMLNNPPDLQVDSEAWAAMQHRLSHQNAPNQNRNLRKYLPFLLLLAIFGGITLWFCNQLASANQRIELLETKINKGSNAIPDTIYQYKTILKRDTVYKYIEITKAISAEVYKNSAGSDAGIPHSESFQHTIANMPAQALIQKSRSEEIEQAMFTEGRGMVAPLAKRKPPEMTGKNDNGKNETTPNHDQIASDLIEPAKSLFRPKTHPRLTLAATGGIGTFFSSSTSQNRMLMAGVNAEVPFSKTVRLFTGIEWQQESYKLNSLFSTPSQDRAEVPGPTNQFNELIERGSSVLTNQVNYLVFPVGVKFILLPNQAVQPYISGGIQLRLPLNSKTDEVLLTDNQIERSSSVIRSIGGERASLNNLWTGLGLQLNWSRRVGIRVEGVYQHQWKATPGKNTQSMKQFGLRGGFHFDF